MGDLGMIKSTLYGILLSRFTQRAQNNNVPSPELCYDGMYQHSACCLFTVKDFVIFSLFCLLFIITIWGKSILMLLLTDIKAIITHWKNSQFTVIKLLSNILIPKMSIYNGKIIFYFSPHCAKKGECTAQNCVCAYFPSACPPTRPSRPSVRPPASFASSF